jgi:hypothetical protein
MRTRLKISILIVVLSTVFYGCESLSESDKVVKQFYENIKTEQYDKIPELLDEQAIVANPAEEWKDMIKNLVVSVGKLKTYSRTSFNTSIKNGVTKTVEDYTVEYENKTLYDRIVVIKTGEKYKILHWQFNSDKSKLDEVE